jgi:hypothetical protein
MRTSKEGKFERKMKKKQKEIEVKRIIFIQKRQKKLHTGSGMGKIIFEA